MSLTVVGSIHGSPGVSSLVMALGAVWADVSDRDRIVVEADPDGGVLAARHEELRADRTLADLAVVARRGLDHDNFIHLARPVWEAVPVIAGPPSAEQTHGALNAGGDRLATALRDIATVDVLVDAGRLTARSPALALARHADTVILVIRPRFEEIALLATRVRELRSVGVHPVLVCVGSVPYDPIEIAATAEMDLLGVIPDDPRSARVLSGGAGSDRRLRRSLLWRSVTELATILAPAPVESADVESTDVEAAHSEVPESGSASGELAETDPPDRDSRVADLTDSADELDTDLDANDLIESEEVAS